MDLWVPQQWGVSSKGDEVVTPVNKIQDRYKSQ
jgi:hypothetical protein